MDEKIREMQEKLQEILGIMSGLIASADASAMAMPDEDAERFDTLEAEAVKIRADIDRMEKLRSWQIKPAPQLSRRQAAQTDEETEGFLRWMRTGDTGPVTHLRAQSEGFGSAGGFTVPEGFRDKIVDRLKAFGGTQAVAESLSTESGQPLPWITIDDTGNEGAVVAENTEPTTGADLVFGEVALGAHKIMSTGTGGDALKLSWELMQDTAVDLEGLIANKLGMRIGRKLAALLATGTGVGEPQGILTGSTAVGGTITTNATGIIYEEAIDVIHSLDPDYRPGARWLMSDGALKLIRRQVDSEGRPLYMPGDSADPSLAPTVGTLADYPVTIDQGFPATYAASAKTLIFGDIAQAFVVRNVRDITLVRLDELFAEAGQVGFFAWGRWDSVVQDNNALVHVLAAA